MSGSGEGELRRHLEGACICNEIARERVQGADTRRLQWADERVRCLHAAEPEGRDAGGAGSAPYEESLSSARFSATAASLSTAPSDAGSSGARENSAPIVTSRIPSPKSSRGPFIALCVHKLPREDVLGEVLTRQLLYRYKGHYRAKSTSADSCIGSSAHTSKCIIVLSTTVH
jgi:hypothetical protein